MQERAKKGDRLKEHLPERQAKRALLFGKFIICWAWVSIKITNEIDELAFFQILN